MAPETRRGTQAEEARRDEVIVALAERLIGDIDALDANRNLAVYEQDARLIARSYLALADALEAVTEERDRLRGEIEDYLLWRPGEAGHAAVHRRLAAALEAQSDRSGE